MAKSVEITVICIATNNEENIENKHKLCIKKSNNHLKIQVYIL